jgi:DNA repair protein RecN (Recombination protein N)
MLRELRIQNFVLIEDLALSFSDGLNILTGETGAGKSILIGAISLLLGGRATPNLIRTGAEEARVEALFDLPVGPAGINLAKTLSEVGLPNEGDGILLKRLLSLNGKGKIYINGSFANQANLEAVSSMLIEIHGQHAHHRLTDPLHQLHLLDAFSNATRSRREYASHFQNLYSLQRERKELETSRAVALREEEFLRFQLSEIDSAALVPGEEEDLLKEERLLQNWGEISRLAHEAHEALTSEEGVLTALGKIAVQIDALSRLSGEKEDPPDLFQEAYLNLKEVARGLGRRVGHQEFDPKRLEEVAGRLHQINRLKKKYSGSVNAVLERRAELIKSLDNIENSGEELTALERLIQREEEICLRQAEQLSRLRQKEGKNLEKEVGSELAALKMEKTRFHVEMEPIPLGKEGADRVGFLISLPGEPRRPIGRVASGGELSRIMMAVKIVLSSQDPVGTLVFDEIDAGIGGGIAEKVGHRLKRLARHHQVFCVTHLPQIASFADRHFSVEKKQLRGRMLTGVTLLQGEERVEEIARMLGGERLTATTRNHAQEMVSAALRSK